jgi:hypothetical protein
MQAERNCAGGIGGLALQCPSTRNIRKIMLLKDKSLSSPVRPAASARKSRSNMQAGCQGRHRRPGPEAAKATAEIVKNGGTAMAVAMNVTDETQVDKGVADAVNTYGGWTS